MPRISRAVAVGYPHHVTQRGNYRQTIFAEPEDYARHLDFLARYAPQHDLEIWAYCVILDRPPGMSSPAGKKEVSVPIFH